MRPSPELCPEHTREALDRYAQTGETGGGFIEAVISNNLMQAVARADAQNLEFLTSTVMYVYNCMPLQCHGSKEKYDLWVQMGGLEGFRARKAAEDK